jgi:cell division protein FtsQ
VPVLAATSRLQERARSRRAERRRRLLRRAGQGLLLLLPVLGFAWVVLGSSWLALDRVQVTGTERLQRAQVVAAVGVPTGTPLGRIDTAEVEDRLSALPPVAEVAVRRDWPGTLEVTVTERVPAAAVAVDGGVQLLDRTGVPFATEPQPPAGLVALQVEQPGPSDPATRAALDVHAALPEPLRVQVTAVQAPSPQGVVLVLADGRSVVWGGPRGSKTKAAAVLALLHRPGEVFDVSGEGVVVVR